MRWDRRPHLSRHRQGDEHMLLCRARPLPCTRLAPPRVRSRLEQRSRSQTRFLSSLRAQAGGDAQSKRMNDSKLAQESCGVQRSPTGTQKGRPLQLRPREEREPVMEDGRQGTRPREWHVPEPTGRSPASEQLARHAHRPWRRHQQSAQGEGGRPQASRGFLTPRNAQAAAC